MSNRLIFVYNAEAGVLPGLIDSVHKMLSPGTYACSLCAITHGVFTVDPRWRTWLQALPYDIIFHHRADFRAAYPTINVTLPTILIDRGSGLRVALNAQQIAATGGVPGLVAALTAEIA